MKDLISYLLMVLMVGINYIWLYIVIGIWLSGKLPERKEAQVPLHISIIILAACITYFTLTDNGEESEYSGQCQTTPLGERCY